MQKYLKKDGGEYKPTGEPGPIQMNANFVRFFNETMRFSDMLYPGGVPSPALRYTLTPIKTDVVQSYSVSIDGQKANLTAGNGKQFSWPGGSGETKITAKVGTADFSVAGDNGLWALFHFFANADNQTQSGSNYILEWIPRQGRNNEIQKVEGREVHYKFQVDVAVFSKNFFKQLGCVSNPAK